MGLGDWVILVSCLGASGLGAYVWIRVKNPRVFKKIPREIQAEIDATPEWWDAQFRKLQGLPGIQKSPLGDFRRWAESGIQQVTDGNMTFSMGHLIDPKPPTLEEIWTPTEGSNYDLVVDLSAMMSALEEAKTNDR